jgi:hypothetical protein
MSSDKAKAFKKQDADKAKIRRIHRVSEMAVVNEKFKAGENLCMLSAMYNAMDKKKQDIVTVGV